jgi:GNAT superfamily N-acetyltransferase
MKIEPWKPPGANEVEMAAVVALYRQGLAAQNPPEQKTAASARSVVEEWFKVPKTAALVAKSFGDKVEGVLFFRNEAPSVRILYLSSREHRKGVGSALVKSLRDLCAKKGVTALKAAFGSKDERQAAFFKKHGFAGATPVGDPAASQVEAALAIAPA